MGIHLFLLKPVVENFFDKVELTWLLQNTQMRESAIKRYMARQAYRTDVFNTLHTLHPYEKKILDGVIFGIDMSTEGSLLSLERTETTICHRDITFTNVPGLQFVVRREDPIPDAVPPNIPEPPVSPRMSSRRRPSRPRRYHYSDDSDSRSRAHRSRAAEDHAPSNLRSVERAIVSSDSEDQGYTHIKADQEPVSLPEQDGDAVIDDMLKKYTTLFD